MLLLNLNYEQLIKINHYMIDNEFWYIKHGQDFILSDFIKLETKLDWKEIYHFNHNIYPIYPLLDYPFTQDDLNKLHGNNIPLLKSSDVDDIIPALQMAIEADNRGSKITVNDKTYLLYNSYNKNHDKVNVYQKEYERCIRHILYKKIKEILMMLKINNYLTIYMFGWEPWGIITTHYESEYQIKYYKSYNYNF
jgi:hypothetical protein